MGFDFYSHRVAHLEDLLRQRNVTIKGLRADLARLTNQTDGLTLSCRLCGADEDARSMGEQLGVSLCRSCEGYFSDEELQEELECLVDFSWEEVG